MSLVPWCLVLLSLVFCTLGSLFVLCVGLVLCGLSRTLSTKLQAQSSQNKGLNTESLVWFTIPDSRFSVYPSTHA